MLTIPAHRRRSVALAMLGASALLLVGAVGLPVWALHRHYDRVLEEQEQRLVRYERVAASKAEVERRLTAARAVGSRKWLLKETVPSLASAEMQDRVRQIVEASGGRLSSLQVTPPGEEGGFRRLGATLQLNANAASLRRMLLSLESAEPYVFVESMTVRSQVPATARARVGVEPENFVQLEVVSFSLKGSGS